MKAANRLVISTLVIAAIALGFFVLALNPKQQEANDLAGEADQLRLSVSELRAKTAEAVAAKSEFPTDYRQLVVLGQAVPASDETSSLLVELNRVAGDAEVEFQSIQLGTGSGESLPPPAPTATTEASPTSTGAPGSVLTTATVPPSEAAASLLPLGATIGSADLAVMPYDLTFRGDFFQIARFIKGLDSLVNPDTNSVAVRGRLLTINGFALTADAEAGFPHLDATFSLTSYLTPPGQGITAGATLAAPATSTATPASTESAESPPEATTVAAPE
jgi:Tfp pilus assembly protein PilO